MTRHQTPVPQNETPRALRARLILVGAVGVVLTLSAMTWPGPAAPRVVPMPAALAALVAAEQPVEQFLQARGSSAPLAHEIAAAVVREAQRAHVRVSLVLGVLMVENPDLKPTARSRQGALGLMQVMPFWSGSLGCTDTTLTSVAGSICHGTRILAAFLREHPDNVRTALLRYNGCVHGTHTPNCHAYPRLVLRQAQAAALALLAYRAPSPVAPPTVPDDDVSVADSAFAVALLQ